MYFLLSILFSRCCPPFVFYTYKYHARPPLFSQLLRVIQLSLSPTKSSLLGRSNTKSQFRFVEWVLGNWLYQFQPRPKDSTQYQATPRKTKSIATNIIRGRKQSRLVQSTRRLNVRHFENMKEMMNIYYQCIYSQ